MRTPAVIITSILAMLLAALLALPQAAAIDRTSGASQPHILVTGLDTSIGETDVNKAVRLFEDQGLALPSIEIKFGSDATHCSGALGLFQPDKDRHVVNICSAQEWVIVHELAHAWIYENVDASTQDVYLELRGLERWNAGTDDWRDRGFEDAAFVMQQLLTPRPAMSESREWRSRRAAFALLTSSRT